MFRKRNKKELARTSHNDTSTTNPITPTDKNSRTGKHIDATLELVWHWEKTKFIDYCCFNGEKADLVKNWNFRQNLSEVEDRNNSILQSSSNNFADAPIRVTKFGKDQSNLNKKPTACLSKSSSGVSDAGSQENSQEETENYNYDDINHASLYNVEMCYKKRIGLLMNLGCPTNLPKFGVRFQKSKKCSKIKFSIEDCKDKNFFEKIHGHFYYKVQKKGSDYVIKKKALYLAKKDELDQSQSQIYDKSVFNEVLAHSIMNGNLFCTYYWADQYCASFKCDDYLYIVYAKEQNTMT